MCMMNRTFELLYTHKLVTSQSDFATNWCLRSPNYLSLGRGVSDAAAMTVLRKLWERGHRLLALRLIWRLIGRGEAA